MAIEYLVGAQSTSYSIVRHHIRIEGRLQLPVYGQNGTASVVGRLHAPMERLIIFWLAEKEGAPPILPHPLLFDANNLFLKGGRSTEAPMLLPSQNAHAWKVWGEYHYAVLVPISLTQNLNTGLIPPDGVTNINDTTIPAGMFRQGFLDSPDTAAFVQPNADPLPTPSLPGSMPLDIPFIPPPPDVQIIGPLQDPIQGP